MIRNEQLVNVIVQKINCSPLLESSDVIVLRRFRRGSVSVHMNVSLAITFDLPVIGGSELVFQLHLNSNAFRGLANVALLGVAVSISAFQSYLSSCELLSFLVTPPLVIGAYALSADSSLHKTLVRYTAHKSGALGTFDTG